MRSPATTVTRCGAALAIMSVGLSVISGLDAHDHTAHMAAMATPHHTSANSQRTKPLSR